MVQSGQSPVNERSWAQRIEPPSLCLWPAQEVLPFAGWVLRFSAGHGHRPNSVAALRFAGGDLQQAISEAETHYRQRGLRPMFQVTAAVEPPHLAAVLEERGYRPITASLVCVADTDTVLARCMPAKCGELLLSANPDFDALVIAGSHSPADGRERLQVLARITAPLQCVTVVIDGKGVACGMGAAVDDLVGINLMRTHPDFRRRGCARQVLGAIASWAHRQGVATLFLNVERDNAPARTLYESVGFVRAYDYLYYVSV